MPQAYMDPPVVQDQDATTAWDGPAFVARWGMGQADLQTLLGALWPRRAGLPQAQGIRVAVDAHNAITALCNWQQDRAGAPALVLVHGLEGNAQTPAMQGLARRALDAGMHAVRMNMRNCGGTDALSTSLYHSGLSGDVDVLVRALLRDCGVKRVGVVGYSMGGNMVLKLAGEWGARPPAGVLGVAAVCPAVDLGLCADLLHLPRNRAYEMYFLAGLVRRYWRKQQQHPDLYGTQLPPWPESLRQWDDQVTAPHSGFSGVDDYYARASARPVLENITVPTLVLHAQDDPFVQLSGTTHAALNGQPHITLVEPPHGGHCGFLGDGAGGAAMWAESTAVAFLQRLAVAS